MMKSSTSFAFSSSLLFFFVASTAVYSQIPNDDDLYYKLSIKTGTVAEAGTDSHIGVKLVDEFMRMVEIPDLLKWGHMPPGHEYFQNGNLDIFIIRAPSGLTLPKIGWISVTSDGSGQKPKWYLEYVKVTIYNSQRGKTIENEFEFNQWLAIDEPPYQLTASRGRKKSYGLSSTINKRINDF